MPGFQGWPPPWETFQVQQNQPKDKLLNIREESYYIGWPPDQAGCFYEKYVFTIHPKLKAGLDADVATDLREGTEWACSKVFDQINSLSLSLAAPKPQSPRFPGLAR